MDNKKVGLFIASLRKEKNKTQKELATKLFISDKAVSKWERGLSMPDIGLIEKLATCLDVSVSEILKGEKLEGMTIKNSDEIVKTSISFFQKAYFRKKITKIISGIIIFLCLGYIAVLCIGEVTYGELRWKLFDGEYTLAYTIPSFSSKMAESASKKFLHSLKNYDYEGMMLILRPNSSEIYFVMDQITSFSGGNPKPEEQNVNWDNYINNLKSLEKAGVRFTRYKLNRFYHDDSTYVCVFDVEIDYNNEKYSMQVQLAHYGKHINIISYGYMATDSLNINNPYKNIIFKDSGNLYKQIGQVFIY